jgi:hypothetical protein
MASLSLGGACGIPTLVSAQSAPTPLLAAAAQLQPDAARGSAPDEQDRRRMEDLVAAIAAELSQVCPLAPTNDQAAFDACRKALSRDSLFKRTLTSFVAWGRPSPEPDTSLKETHLTQFGPEIFAGLYFPMFMFNGQYKVEYVPAEKKYRARLGALFRNRMAPGQYPYPFWHSAKKWSDYQQANSISLWLDPKKGKILVVQVTNQGDPDPRLKSEFIAREFDGNWMWTDAAGKTQPQVTLFDGLFRADNPYLGKLDKAYRDLALALREGQCMECHVPNNPDKMKRLVLLQTPAHAASEIERVMKSVRDDSMPRDEHGVEQPLDAATKKVLLKQGEAFKAVVNAARKWEKNQSMRTAASQASGAVR